MACPFRLRKLPPGPSAGKAAIKYDVALLATGRATGDALDTMFVELAAEAPDVVARPTVI